MENSAGQETVTSSRNSSHSNHLRGVCRKVPMLSCWDFSFEKNSRIIIQVLCSGTITFFTFSIQICGNNGYSIRYRPECAIYLRSFIPISELHYDTYFVFMTLESVDSYFYVSRLSSDLFKYEISLFWITFPCVLCFQNYACDWQHVDCWKCWSV